ncbi:MAG TPA: hypothetical protein VK633_04810 [Verrucomicrobiae bacterium]|nr:hypothetical protein [Verrucomicrobiae bacterium]
MNDTSTAIALSPELYRWLLWGGIGLLGAWLLLRVVLALTSVLVRMLWVVGLLLLILWAVTHFL